MLLRTVADHTSQIFYVMRYFTNRSGKQIISIARGVNGRSQELIQMQSPSKQAYESPTVKYF